MHHRAILFSIAIAVLTFGPCPALSEEMKVQRLRSGALGVVERQVRQSFPDIKHVSTTRLAELLDLQPDQLVLLDVRSKEEINVSALPGAHPVSPGARSTLEIAGLRDRLDGKVVVAYCAIGLRSARLLVRIGRSLTDRGAIAFYNLEGGLFRWRNEGRPLTGPQGPTRDIHAYNTLWRQFLEDDPD